MNLRAPKKKATPVKKKLRKPKPLGGYFTKSDLRKHVLTGFVFHFQFLCLRPCMHGRTGVARVKNAVKKGRTEIGIKKNKN